MIIVQDLSVSPLARSRHSSHSPAIDRRGGRHAAAHPHALGLGAVVVVKANQGIKACDIQRACVSAGKRRAP
jgi:hypothetical protein